MKKPDASPKAPDVSTQAEQREKHLEEIRIRHWLKLGEEALASTCQQNEERDPEAA